ncbi:MAG: polyprenyl synthetase family protein [Phycisphaerales bacterium]|nr:polyprenyl synthetase family protein [Phycisphaerales bacterium]
MRSSSTSESEVFSAAVMGLIEDRLARFVADAGYSGNLREAVGYSLLGGGKRLRPLLTIRCCEAVGASTQAALEAACAVEMVHAFSLVHDDLPALDNDSMRRGKPTAHVVFGEAMAILAGDALLALALHAACSSLQEPGRIAHEITNATSAMITGQVLDTLGGFAPGLGPRERLHAIHTHKTGALIRCSCRIGAICGGARPGAFAAIDHWGDSIGLMFQAVDDLLDVTQSADHVGKAVAKDAGAGKLTYPEVYGLEETRHEIARLRAQSLTSLESLGSNAEHLLTLTEFLAGRTR